jgi:hypothetical protein
MRIENKTRLPTEAIRRMALWICRKLECSVKHLRLIRVVHVRYSLGGMSGLCTFLRGGKFRIICRTGRDGGYPRRSTWRVGTKYGHGQGMLFLSPVDDLFWVMVHEIEHGRRYAEGCRERRRVSQSERLVDLAAFRLYGEYFPDRHHLQQEWGFPAEGKPVVRKASGNVSRLVSPEAAKAREAGIIKAKVRRREAAARNLAKWERREAEAAAKVAKWRRRVQGYRRLDRKASLAGVVEDAASE